MNAGRRVYVQFKGWWCGDGRCICQSRPRVTGRDCAWKAAYKAKWKEIMNESGTGRGRCSGLWNGRAKGKAARVGRAEAGGPYRHSRGRKVRLVGRACISVSVCVLLCLPPRKALHAYSTEDQLSIADSQQSADLVPQARNR